MQRPHPARWLSEQARTGLRDLPSNAGWVASQIARPGEAAAAGTRQRARKLKQSVVEVAPGGESVDKKMKRARAAASRAHEAEEEALGVISWSDERSEHVREVAESNRVWLEEVKREVDERVEQRVAEARRAAEEQVAQELAAAQSEAAEDLQEAQQRAAEELEAAQGEAERAQQLAQDTLAEARERFAEARQLADEATQAAREAAEEANRQARALAKEAEQQAKLAEAKFAAAGQLRDEATASTRETVQELQRQQTNGGLKSQTKAELLETAGAMGIEGRASMNKAELISAITKAARDAR